MASKRTILYNKLRTPDRGHALVELLEERELISLVSWSGSFGFETEEQMKTALVYRDLTKTGEDAEMDQWTGKFKNEMTWDEMKLAFPTFPSFTDIDNRYNEICEQYDEYEGKRARVYPSYLDQLDMLFHDIDQGLFGAAAKTGDFYTAIKAVKDANQ
jgi:hypothetical protein